MPETTAQQIFKDLEKGLIKPFYLVYGEEPFQANEILDKVKARFVTEENKDFNFEVFEGEGLKASELLASINQMPGLFAEESSIRFVLCERFDKVAAGELEKLEEYFKNPSPTTALFITASKIDKRKGWYKKVLDKGAVVEVTEPYDNEWPKWQNYFEKKIGKKIAANAWPTIVETSNKTLSLIWMEVQKAATFVGNKNEITEADAKIVFAGNSEIDVFKFAEDVVEKRKGKALINFHRLIEDGENEIKILSILVRQFRMVENCLRLLKSGERDTKIIAKEIGSHPFFVSQVIDQAKKQTLPGLGKTLSLLTTCDYQMKRGETDLFRGFLLPYFS